MATFTKLYFHTAASAIIGILPPSGGLQSSGDKSGTDANTNKSMDTTIGLSQVSTSIVSLGTMSGQNLRLSRYVGPLLAAQTIAAQIIKVHVGAQQSNANAAARPAYQLFHWRPSTGAKITNMVLGPRDAPAISGTSEVNAITADFTSSAATVLDGDVLVLELWVNAAQVDTGTYTDTLFYDGTTEDSTTTNAAYVLFASPVTLYSAPTGRSFAVVIT